MAGVLFCAVVVDVGQGGTSQTHPYTQKQTHFPLRIQIWNEQTKRSESRMQKKVN